MRIFNPWIGNLYGTEGFRGLRVLILGESHYGGAACEYPSYTTEVIKQMALQKGRLPFFCKIQRLIVGGRAGFSNAQRTDFWQRVSFYNFIQSSLEHRGCRPTGEMWEAGRTPFLETLQELSPELVLVLGIELQRNLPPIPTGKTSLFVSIQHPSYRRFRNEQWQPKVQAGLETAIGLPKTVVPFD